MILIALPTALFGALLPLTESRLFNQLRHRLRAARNAVVVMVEFGG